MVLEVIFWILLLLLAIGAWAPPQFIKGVWVVVIIEVAILGLKVFHNPLTH